MTSQYVLINSNFIVYKLSLNYCSFKAIAGCPSGFIFQQDSASAHTARSARNRLRTHCPDFTTKDQWPPNLPNINSMDYHMWGAMLEAYCKLITKPKSNRWRQRSTSGYLGQTAIRTDWQGCERVIKLSDWRLLLELGAGSGHFEHSQWRWNSGVWSLINCVVSTMLLNWCCSLNIF